MKRWGKPIDRSNESVPPNEWLDYFQKLFSQTQPTKSQMLEELNKLENEPFFSEQDVRISQKEIHSALKRLNKKSSPGPDCIPANLIVAGRDSLVPLLEIFYNKIFSHCTHPTLFSSNFLIAILKKG